MARDRVPHWIDLSIEDTVELVCVGGGREIKTKNEINVFFLK